MKLTGLHLLLTYKCTLECDHCFVWGSPWQSGVMTLDSLRRILDEAQAAGVSSIYFEGGEPFLFYPLLLSGVRDAAGRGFSVGIVSNAYWATTLQDARAWLEPFAGLVQDLAVSTDLFHADEMISVESRHALAAAGELGIPTGSICIAQPEAVNASCSSGQLPSGESAVMYRGRAARKLARRAGLQSWRSYDKCPHEDLVEPGRVHVDPYGNLFVCQGIIVGNLFERPLTQICADYAPAAHPIVGPLLDGGPAALVRRYQLDHSVSYADACHLCFTARLALRARFPEWLGPDQMYGAPEA